MDVTCVVLAAGRAVRMGGGKLLRPFGDGTVLDAVLKACAGRPTVVVASREVADRLAAHEGIAVVVNDAPERGMAHSLRLANRAVRPEDALAVLLGDKPLVSRELVARTVEAFEPGIDVAYPVRDGTPGHPVVFSPRARGAIEELCDGDTLHRLRDDPRFVRRAVPIDDEGAYADVDTDDDYRRLIGR